MRLRMAAPLAAALFAGWAAMPARTQAVAPLRPAFTDAVCNARPPAISHAWARGIEGVQPGRVIPVATTFSNEDNADLLFKLGLLEGHLMVGRELIAAGNPTLALPHFGHPVRELYDDISAPLRERGVTGFDMELVALEALAAAKPGDPAFVAKYNEVIGIVTAARATVPQALQGDPRFMAGVYADLAEIAAGDYNESIEAGRITKPVEYHDSRGYLAYASRSLDALLARPDLAGNTRLLTVRREITDMQTVVGSLIPPERPRASAAAYRALAGKIRATSRAADA
jgi:hypothetical protein